jgi:Uncharacterized protein conserved in bacteria
MIEKTVCFTGHRDIPADKVEYVKSELRREIEAAVADGYEHFISGFAEGVDLMAAAAVVELREKYPQIRLEAAIPYRKRVMALTENAETAALLRQCHIIGVHSEEYFRDCFMRRNRIMLFLSTRVIAVYDGRDKGGTVQTLRFAHIHEKEIHEIRI